MQVNSDNSDVRRLVTLIAQTVVAEGGFVHPELVVRHEGASLWLELPRGLNPYAIGPDGQPLDEPHPEAAPLLVVPDALHIPVSDLDWEPHDSELRYRANTDHLSAAQRTILDAMVELFNTIDKVRVIGQSYAIHALADDPELLALIREARPSFDPDADRGHIPGEASPARTVVNSRLRSGMGEGDEGPIGYFMPMIDMLNHHPYGSRYRRTEDDAWRIDVHHPTPTDEVFVRYNKADSLGVALGLGYVETDTRFVASVDCRIDVAGLGPVHVVGVGGQRRRLPAPRIVRGPHGWRIVGLVLDPGTLDKARTLLTMPLQSAFPEHSAQEAAARADDLLRGVIAANAAYYERLLVACTPPFGNSADAHQRALFAGVAAHQLHVLRRISDRLTALSEA